MKRAAIFAHYDSDNVIEEYVIHYLKELKKEIDYIVFVSDCNLSEKELNKLSGIADYTIAKRHGEYDFGSYKRGYIYLKGEGALSDYDELLLVNDSCFGFTAPISGLFDKYRDFDFWGMNKNETDTDFHIQSFFILFKKNVFTSKIFDDFMLSVQKEENKDEIIKKYEIGLSKLLISNGFKAASVFKNPIERQITGDLFFGEKNFLIKTLAFKEISPALASFLIRIFVKTSDYPFHLILNYMQNKAVKGSFKNDFKAITKLILRLQLKRRRFYFLGKWFSF